MLFRFTTLGLKAQPFRVGMTDQDAVAPGTLSAKEYVPALPVTWVAIVLPFSCTVTPDSGRPWVSRIVPEIVATKASEVVCTSSLPSAPIGGRSHAIPIALVTLTANTKCSFPTLNLLALLVVIPSLRAGGNTNSIQGRFPVLQKAARAWATSRFAKNTGWDLQCAPYSGCGRRLQTVSFRGSERTPREGRSYA